MPTTHPDESNAVLLEAAALFFPKTPRPDAGHRTAASQDMWRLAKELRLKHSSEVDPQKAAELEAAQALHRQQARRRQKERAASF